MAPRKAISSQSEVWQMNSQFPTPSKHCLSRSSQHAQVLGSFSKKYERKALRKHAEGFQTGTSKNILKEMKSCEILGISSVRPVETCFCSSNPSIHDQNSQPNNSVPILANSNQGKNHEDEVHALKGHSTVLGRLIKTLACSSNPSLDDRDSQPNDSATISANLNRGKNREQKVDTSKPPCTRTSCNTCAKLKDSDGTTSHELSKPGHVLSSKPSFEVMNSEGCWWDVDILCSRGEMHRIHYIHFDSDEDEDVHLKQIRLRSRKATPYDCFHCLRPGVDITVFSVHPEASKRAGDNIRTFAAWYDARIRHVYRMRHEPDCLCKFLVQFYSASTYDQIENGKRMLLRGCKKKVGINKIGILQKPFQSCLQDVLATNSHLKVGSPKLVWSSDTWSLKGQFFMPENGNEKFAVDLEQSLSEEEPLTTNVHSQLISSHDMSSQNSKLSSQSPSKGFVSYLEKILDSEVDTNHEKSYSSEELSAVSAKPKKPPLRGRFKKSHPHDSKSSKSCSRSVKRQLLPDEIDRRFSSKVGHSLEKETCAVSNGCSVGILSANEKNDHDSGLKSPGEVKLKTEITKGTKKSKKQKSSIDDAKPDSKDKRSKDSIKLDNAMYSTAEVLGEKKMRKHHLPSDKNTNAEVEEWCDAIFKGDFLQLKDHQHKKERKFEPPLKEPQKGAHLLWSDSLEDGLLDSPNAVAEAVTEFGEMWQEMRIAMHKTTELMSKASVIQESDFCVAPILLGQSGCAKGHSFMFSEEEGLVCEFCGFIGLEIENMAPTLDAGTLEMRHQKVVCNSDDKDDELSDSLIGKLEQEEFCRRTKPLSRIVPHLKAQMHKHQKEGFKFLWKNIAGDRTTNEVESTQDETGGCILSHAPGTGKSLLIISFLHSFLQVNPHCKPLIVAPKIMLRPWQREFLKWKVDIPVYILNTEREYRKGMALEEDDSGIITLKNGTHLPAMELGRIITLSHWYKHESVLLVSYSLFSTLIEQGTSVGASNISKNIAEILLRSPDLLILDEGHFPRNKDTKVRAALMKIHTKLRILLSGTVFQNNFEELFNILYLVRPQFVGLISQFINLKDGEFAEKNEMVLDETPMSSCLKRRSSNCRIETLPGDSSPVNEVRTVVKIRSHTEEAASKRPIEVIEIDDLPEEVAYNKRSVRRKVCRSSFRLRRNCVLEDEQLRAGDLHSENSLEAKSRRLFMKTIGSKFEESQREKSLQDGFQILRKLTDPFVHYYSGEILQSLPGLHDFAVMLKPTTSQKDLLQKTLQKWDSKSPLEIEMAVSAICIHPCLLVHLKFDEIETMELSEFEFLRKDPDAGVKTMFVVELLRLCQCTSEKVLIFSEILSPFILLEQLLEDSLGWVKGKETLRLDGKLSLDERQMIIDRINQPADPARVLFASIKACGEGITLTGASRVVFLHMAWNPSVMKQAISRAFRLGQKRPVYVYRLVASGTMEDDKYKRTVWKDWLSRSIFVSHTCNDKNQEMINKNIPESLKKSEENINLLYDACHDKMLEKLLEISKMANSFQKIKYCSLLSKR